MCHQGASDSNWTLILLVITGQPQHAAWKRRGWGAHSAVAWCKWSTCEQQAHGAHPLLFLVQLFVKNFEP